MHRLALLACLILVGCADDEITPVSTTPEPVPAPEPPSEPTPESAPIEGLEGLEAPPTESEVAPTATVSDSTPEAGHTCVLASETRTVLEHASATSVVAGYLGQLFVAAYVREGENEAVAVVRVLPNASPELVTRIPLSSSVAEMARTAPPGLATLGSSLLLAATDGAGHLLYTEIEMAVGAVAGSFRVQLDEAHADPRFAPLVTTSSDGTRVIAWTDGSGTPMRVRLARLSAAGEVLGTEVISPDGGGAAPVLGLGEREPAIYFVEARIAMSAAHRVALGSDGTPGRAEVARPLLRGSDVPAIAVVRGTGGSRSHLAYAAVGNLATRAIGLVQTTGTDSPLPLVAGLGYGGALSVRAVPLTHSVAFAVEAPSAAEPTAPHEVRVRIATDEGALGEPLVLSGQTAPDLAVLSSEGTSILLGVSGRGARVTFVRCTE